MKRCTFRPGSLIRASNSTAASAPICSGLISTVLSGGLEWIVSRMLSNPMRSKSTPVRRERLFVTVQARLQHRARDSTQKGNPSVPLADQVVHGLANAQAVVGACEVVA